MRLIDADKLVEDAELSYVKVGARSNGKSILTLAKTWLLNEVESAPTVEAKPVVYCKDCKCSRMYCFGDCEEPVLACCDIDDDGTIYCAESVNEYDYCSKGEKRDAQMDEGVKIPLISMEDVPKIMEEMEK